MNEVPVAPHSYQQLIGIARFLDFGDSHRGVIDLWTVLPCRIHHLTRLLSQVLQQFYECHHVV